MVVLSVEGTVDERFSGVRDAFTANFERFPEVGAGVAVYVDGKEVVNLWAGEARPGVPWRQDTLVPVLSVGKAISALAVQVLQDRGLIDLDARVSEIWPAFAANGKEDVTVEQVLTHSAGLPWWPDYQQIASFDDPASFARTEEIYAALASAPPIWEPGTKSGQHSITIGWLHAELVRRAAGVPLRAFVAREIAAPLDAELWFGVDEDIDGRTALALPDSGQDSDVVRAKVNPDTPPGRTLLLGWNVPPGSAIASAVNDPVFRRSDVPAANLFADVRSLSRVFGALARDGSLSGHRLVSPESVRLFAEERHHGPDAIAPIVVRHSLGYILPVKGGIEFGPNDAAFGHPAKSGAVAFADPVAKVGFAYAPGQQLTGYVTDPRATALIDEVYQALR